MSTRMKKGERCRSVIANKRETDIGERCCQHNIMCFNRGGNGDYRGYVKEMYEKNDFQHLCATAF